MGPLKSLGPFFLQSQGQVPEPDPRPDREVVSAWFVAYSNKARQ